MQEDFRFNTLIYRLKEEKLKQLWLQLESIEAKAVLIKGWSIAQYYSQKFKRIYTDYDICVSSNNYHKTVRFFNNWETKFPVDIHLELRQLDTVPWENLFENSQIIKLDETEIRVLRPEDHLRVICVHWLTDGGEYRERLWDVYWMITNRPENFDWDRCLNIVSQRRRRWIVCTIGLAHKYLGLDLSGTPIEEEAKDLPKWLTKSVEKEWKSDVRLIPLSSAKRNYKIFLQQVWKRFPPNPVTATIDCEGDFDTRTRIFYQIRDMFKRLKFGN